MTAPDHQANIRIARRWWRPLFAFAATLCVVSVVATVCFLLLAGLAQLGDVQGVVIAIVTALMTPLSVFIGGRSYEKSTGAANGVLQSYELHSGPVNGGVQWAVDGVPDTSEEGFDADRPMRPGPGPPRRL